jgi:hypothetical protein
MHVMVGILDGDVNGDVLGLVDGDVDGFTGPSGWGYRRRFAGALRWGCRQRWCRGGTLQMVQVLDCSEHIRSELWSNKSQ